MASPGGKIASALAKGAMGETEGEDDAPESSGPTDTASDLEVAAMKAFTSAQSPEAKVMAFKKFMRACKAGETDY